MFLKDKESSWQIRQSEISDHKPNSTIHNSNYYPQKKPTLPIPLLLRKRSRSLNTPNQSRNFLKKPGISQKNQKPDKPVENRITEEDESWTERQRERESDERLTESDVNDCSNPDCPNRGIKALYDELQEEFRDKTQENRNLNKRLSDFQEIKKLSGGVLKNDNKVEKLEHEISLLQFKNKNLENELEYLNTVVENKKEEIKTKNKLIEEGNMEKEGDKFVESIIREKADLSFQVTNLKSQNDEMKKSFNNLARELQQVKQGKLLRKETSEEFLLDLSITKSELNGKFQKKETDNNHLLVELKKVQEQLKTTSNRFKLEIADLKEGNEELANKHTFEKEDAMKLKKAYEQLLQDMKIMEENNNELKSKYKDAKHHSDTVDKEKESIKSEIESLNNAIYSLNKEKSEWESRVYDLNDLLIECYGEVCKIYNREKEISVVNKEKDGFNNRSLILLGTKEAKTIIDKILEIVKSENNNKQEKNDSSEKNVFASSLMKNDKQHSLKTLITEFISKVEDIEESVHFDFPYETKRIIEEVEQTELTLKLLKEEMSDMQDALMILRQEEKNAEKFIIQITDEIGHNDDEEKIWTSFTPTANQTIHHLLLKLHQKTRKFLGVNSKSPVSKRKSDFSVHNKSFHNNSIDGSDMKKNSKQKHFRESELVQLKYIKEILSRGNEMSGEGSKRNSNFSDRSQHNSVQSMPIQDNKQRPSSQLDHLQKENKRLKEMLINIPEKNFSKNEENFKKENNKLKIQIEELTKENMFLKEEICRLVEGESPNDAKDNSNMIRYTNKTTEGEDLEYNLSENNNEEDKTYRDTNDPNIYCEFEDENDLKNFLDELIKANKERVEELQQEIDHLKEKLEEKEIENKKLKLSSTLSKNKETIVGEEENELGRENNRLCAQVFKLSNEISELKRINEELVSEINKQSIDGSSSILINQSDLLQSDHYHINISDLNPNKDVARNILLKELQERNEEQELKITHLVDLHNQLLIENDSLKESIRRIHTSNKALIDKLEGNMLGEEEINAYLEDIRSLYAKLDYTGDKGKSRISDSNEENTEHTKNLKKTIDDLKRKLEELKVDKTSLEKECLFLVEERKELMAQIFKISNKAGLKDKEIEAKTFKLSIAYIQNALLKSELERKLC